MRKTRNIILRGAASFLFTAALFLLSPQIINAEEITAQEQTWQAAETGVDCKGVEGTSEEEANLIGEQIEENGAVLITAAGETTPAGSDKSGINVSFEVGEEVYYGNWFTHKFYMNGNLAYCLQPELTPPEGGQYIAEVIDNNLLLQKGLYYLMGGPGWTEEVRNSLFDDFLTDNNIYAYCHVVLSYIYNGCDLNSSAFTGLTQGEIEGLINITEAVGRREAPPLADIHFDKGENTAYFDEQEKVQRTEEITLEAEGSNSVTVPVPKGAVLVYRGAEYTENAVIQGGTSFYLKADVGYANGGKWDSGILYGTDTNSWKALALKTSGGTQAIGGWTYTIDETAGMAFSVKWLEKPDIIIEKTADKADKIYKDGDIITYTVTLCQPVEHAVGKSLVIKDTITKPEEGIKLQKNSIVLLNEEDIPVSADISVKGNSFTISGGDALAYTKAVSGGQAWKVEYQVKITDASKVVETIHNEVSAKFENSAEVMADEDVTTTKEKPEIATRAKDKVTNTKKAMPRKETVLIDTVDYKNLIKEEEYTLKGIIMEKNSGEPLMEGGKEITAEKKFTAGKDGAVTMEFLFDSTAFKGKSLVIFEYLYDKENNLAASHEDINDKGQTVEILDCKISTKAKNKATDTNTGSYAKEVTLADTIEYTNFAKGEYTAEGILMDKSSGEVFIAEGSEVAAKKDFKADKKGSVELEFTFDASGLEEKKTELVVYEKVYDKLGNLVAAHEDIEDKGQTVILTSPERAEEVYHTGTPKTGDYQNIALWMLASCTAFCSCVKIARKTKNR